CSASPWCWRAPSRWPSARPRCSPSPTSAASCASATRCGFRPSARPCWTAGARSSTPTRRWPRSSRPRPTRRRLRRSARTSAMPPESCQRSELRFRNAMRFSAIGQALLDRRGTIVDANPALAAIFETTTDALVGSAFGSHFVDAHDHLRRSREFAAAADGVFRTTRQWRARSGELRHAHLTYAPVPGEIGQDVASLVQVEDITERVLAHAREQALNRTLEARVALRTRELTHANQELESFAYSISHDLRAPLRTIEPFSRPLGERYADKVDETGRDYLSRVRNAAGRMD